MRVHTYTCRIIIGISIASNEPVLLKLLEAVPPQPSIVYSACWINDHGWNSGFLSEFLLGSRLRAGYCQGQGQGCGEVSGITGHVYDTHTHVCGHVCAYNQLEFGPQ